MPGMRGALSEAVARAARECSEQERETDGMDMKFNFRVRVCRG